MAQRTSATDQAGLAEEQAALRGVATLVAQQASPEDVFAAVTEAVGPLLGADLSAMMVYPRDGTAVTTIAGWSAVGPMIPIGTQYDLDGDSVAARVFRTGASARMDSYVDVDGQAADIARNLGLRSTVGAPIVVEGTVWGALMAATRGGERLPETTEPRMAAFTELVAIAIANVEARRNLQQIAREQEELRKAATLVASGASPREVFAQITASASDVFGVPFASLIRLRPDRTATMVAGCQACSAYVGMSWEMPDDDPGIARKVITTRKPARVEDHSRVSGPVGEAARALGVGSVAGAPIVVDGEAWGVLVVGASHDGPTLPADVGERLAAFTELVTTTLSNAEARQEVRRLLEEQETLRRVATLVAEGAGPDAVFAAVCDEAVELFGAEQAAVVRLEVDAGALVTAGLSAGLQGLTIGMRSALGDWPTSSAACRTGQPARIDMAAEEAAGSGTIPDMVRAKGFLSTISAPIVVDNSVWGALTVSDSRQPLAADTESRIENFTELIATAIANREAREALTASEARARELANVQAALGRVATLVARGASPDELFSAVAAEAAEITDIAVVGVTRYEADNTFTILAITGETHFAVGSCWPVEEEGVAGRILATGEPARWDDYSTMPGRLGEAVRQELLGSIVGVPVVVEGRIWGFIVAAATPGRPIPTDTEAQLARFTGLVATAVSNASTRAELLTSRARLVSTADETRRRLERDLHDGIQQWLVALALRARKAARLSAAGKPLEEELSGLADDLVGVTEELREISRGIHPAILTEAGLDDALAALARRSAIRVDLDVSFQRRYDPTLEATVYYLVAESISNAVKHAQASSVAVRGGSRGGLIELEIEDDGVGGAAPGRGTGLIGLKDRVDTLGGTISLVSPAGVGTTIRARLPAGPRDGDPSPAPRPAEAAPVSTSG